ncbi:MAG TPA: ribosome biogenesis GTPase YlqF [Pseudomonadales bacterium]|nr:ribosome biogenesis GTPase YlqF [Pseudomonadales bacterium]
MAIHWFPGHMHKARKEMKEVLPLVDVIIEVIDARIPYSSENPMIAEMRGDKPCLKILNKADLADPSITAQWLAHLSQRDNMAALEMCAQEANRAAKLKDLIRQLCPQRAGQHRAIHTMICGIPNVGKSTLINSLAGRMIAKTGNEPAITKGQQRINLGDGITLSDTPGILWPKVENPKSSYRLAVTGAIRETAMDHDDVAFFGMDYLLHEYPQALADRYGFDPQGMVEVEAIEELGRRRGCLRGGKQVDLNRACKLFLTELREGRLGPISLETPTMMAQELIDVDLMKAQKEAEREARKAEKMKGKRKPS